jgi:DNA-directed RNA polymerase specialized sigma24 family protein
MGESAAPGSAPGLRQGGSRDALWRLSKAGGDATAVSGPVARQALDRAYQAHYRSLVRLAALLTGDDGIAEQVTQDSFVTWYRSAGRLRRAEADRAALLRLVIVRARRAAGGRAGCPAQTEQTATAFAGMPVVRALAELPHPQREAVVLTLYLELTERQAAAAVGVGQTALRRNLACGVRAMSEMPCGQG